MIQNLLNPENFKRIIILKNIFPKDTLNAILL